MKCVVAWNKKMNVIERVMNNEEGYFACEKQHEDIWGIWFDIGLSMRL